ncbi:MAG: DNA repair protein RecO (recombination protein O), partial [Halieaceae bacterium]
EARVSVGRLQGEYLFSGLYINELLIRLLPHEDPHPSLYQAYENLVMKLLGATDLEPVLREFEFLLLEELGYGIELEFDAEAGTAIMGSQLYCYLPETGLVPFRPDFQKLPTYRGDCLLAMSAGRYDEEVRISAKRLLRQALSAQLGDKPLNSRALFA